MRRPALYTTPAPGTEDEFEIRHEELAAQYLRQALDALRDAGDPDRLYPPRARAAERTVADEALARYIGASRRLDFSRNSVLFSALACEAYANRFLSLALNARTAAAIDRLSTVDKLLVGTQLVKGTPVFDRGAEPLQTVSDLFKLRNHLVHPKRRRVSVKKGSLARPGDGDYNPQQATRYLVAVATIALELDTARGATDDSDTIALAIWNHRAELHANGNTLSSALPSPSDPRPPGLDEWTWGADN
jgi:hypothetical protein